MSYFFDVYRKEIPAEKSIIDVSLYIAFFPQLVAGPIVRAADFLPQLTRRRFFSDVNLRGSLLLFAIGFIKKACIADGLAPYVDRVFADPASFDAISIFSAVIFYAMQIYCDFSGYSDMAIAAAGLLGYHLVINFRAPYLSANITEFWRRWHISLSTWLRDYLYIPLGGNRHGPRRRDRNLMLTMVLGGLWHGASYNFIVWGFMHGLALIVRREWAAHRPAIGSPLPLSRFFSGLLTFYWVCIAWIFFRATTLPAALDITYTFVTLRSPGTEHVPLGAPWIAVVLLMAAQWADQKYGIVKRIESVSWPAFYGGLGTATAFALALVPGGARPFIYFQF
jgi:D-alanyl-lipoteichoic acid acyltransferase DltB (MBOAT superfamily)